MLSEADAIAVAVAHAAANLPELGERPWRATRFPGGWLTNPEGDDLARRTGVPCLVVLDDGTVHVESSSLPPSMLIAKHAEAAAGGVEPYGG